MNKDAQRALTRARTQLLFSHGFFGALALRLRIEERSSEPTAAVNGKTIFYNPDYVLELSEELRQSLVAHEVMHCVLDHMGRMQGRTLRRWNQAADYAINQILEDAGLPLGPKWLIAPQFKGMSAEEIYNILPPEDPNNPDPNLDPLDELEPAQGTPDPAQAVEWQIAAGQAAQAAASRGKLPGSLQRFIEELGKPKVDWRAHLRRFATEIAKNDFSWSRPQRRFMSMGLVLPGMYSEGMGCMVAVSDDSGSVSTEILNALATEIDSIATSTNPQRLIHISCDARVNHVGEFGPGETFRMVSKGGGGTDFRPPFDYLEEQNIEPACLVYLTDGYGPFPEAPPPYPVLWVMTTDVVPPWGEHVRIEL